MAKKQPGFIMAEEIRTLLKADKTLTGKQVEEALRTKFPRVKINSNSCGVAYSGARRQLGITGKKRVVRKKRPAATAASATVDFDTLRAAKQFLASCGGDTDVAVSAIRQLSSLQIS